MVQLTCTANLRVHICRAHRICAWYTPSRKPRERRCAMDLRRSVYGCVGRGGSIAAVFRRVVFFAK